MALASVAAATVGMTLAAPHFLSGGPLPPLAPVRALCHWDCWWYLRIAQEGYSYRPGEQSAVAYFPGYPAAIAALSATGLPTALAAVLLSFGCGVLAVLALSRLALQLTPASVSPAVWLYALYPYAFYLYGVVYADALYVLLAVLAFSRLERGHPWQAAALGALAAATRPVGLAIAAGLTVRAVELKLRRGLRPGMGELVPALALAGLAAWMAYQWWAFGDALAFVHTQASPGWDQPPGLRTWLKLGLWESVFPVYHPRATKHLVQGAIALGVLALAVPTARRVGLGYGVYVALVIGLPLLSSKDFQGLGRYALAAFPVWLTLGAWLARAPSLVQRGVVLASLALLLALAAAFGADVYLS